MHVELIFSLTAVHSIPSDHGYLLYSAISQLLPEVHGENRLAIHPIRGQQIGDRMIQLTNHSCLSIRVPDGEIAPLLKLAGQALRIGATSIRVGVPQIQGLTPATTLRSRLVVIKVANTNAQALTPETFLEAARKQLTTLGISDQALLTIPAKSASDLDQPPQPQRRTLRIHDKEIVGYELLVEGLTAEESITLQEHGLGGKRHMGCGVFSPVSKRGETP